MAATAVYIRMASIPEGGKSQGDTPPAFSNISATTAAFILAVGGRYGYTVIGSTFGTVTLQVLGPDDSTYLTAATAVAANGYATVQLPPGTYRWAIA